LKLQQQSNPASPSGHRTQSSGFSFAFLTSQLFFKWFCMPYLLGIDEAGYAPNLGPLVVGASSWRTPTTDCDLYQLLESALSATSVEGKIAIADSKELHTTDSLLRLEQNLWAVCPQFQHATSGNLSDLLRACSPDLPLQKLVAAVAQGSLLWSSDDQLPSLHQQLDQVAELEQCDLALPRAATPGSVVELTAVFQASCADQGAELLGVHSAPLFPAIFNELTERLGNKSHLLTGISLQLARHLLDSLPADREPVVICCDKHGGRNRYANAIAKQFAVGSVRHECETAHISRYHFAYSGRDVRIQFAAGGESELAVALASMYAKYVRELCMEAFNRYWQAEMPDLEPTKGYPVDALRFRAAIEPLIAARGWEEHTWWRMR
jgi:ribonuclease HII